MFEVEAIFLELTSRRLQSGGLQSMLDDSLLGSLSLSQGTSTSSIDRRRQQLERHYRVLSGSYLSG